MRLIHEGGLYNVNYGTTISMKVGLSIDLSFMTYLWLMLSFHSSLLQSVAWETAEAERAGRDRDPAASSGGACSQRRGAPGPEPVPRLHQPGHQEAAAEDQGTQGGEDCTETALQVSWSKIECEREGWQDR